MTYSENLDLFAWTEPVATPEHKPTIDERFTAFHAANPHVFAEALRIARAWLDRGDRYISAKAILEVMRTSVSTTGEGGYRMNNDFSAPLSRALRAVEPRLADVMHTRRTKS